MSKVFLGGTCNGSTWREELIPQLQISYFNPVVEDWNEEAQAKEETEKNSADYCLYTITPRMTGVYSIAEAVDDSNKRPNRTLFCVLESDGEVEFDKHQLKSLKATARIISGNGARIFHTLEDVAGFLNS